MYNLNEALLNKNDEGKDNDDGLLSKITKKKENPEYTDYKNKQIMSGKVVKSEKGWKKDEKRKARIKRLVGAGALVGGTALLVNHKKNKDPVNRSIKGQEKAQLANITAYNKEIKRGAKRQGRRQARQDQYEQTHGKKATGLRKMGVNLGLLHEEQVIDYLLENYSKNEINSFLLSFDEGKYEKMIL